MSFWYHQFAQLTILQNTTWGRSKQFLTVIKGDVREFYWAKILMYYKGSGKNWSHMYINLLYIYLYTHTHLNKTLTYTHCNYLRNIMVLVHSWESLRKLLNPYEPCLQHFMFFFAFATVRARWKESVEEVFKILTFLQILKHKKSAPNPIGSMGKCEGKYPSPKTPKTRTEVTRHARHVATRWSLGAKATSLSLSVYSAALGLSERGLWLGI